MRKLSALLVVLSVAFACSRASNDEGPIARRAALTDPTPMPTCIRSWPESRYRPYGFDHVVHIANACTIAAECLVSTDVNPEEIPATVPADSEVLVLTFVGSPARTFTPSVWCQLRARSVALAR